MFCQSNLPGLTVEQLMDQLYPQVFSIFVRSNPALQQRAGFYRKFINVFNITSLFNAGQITALQVFELGSGTGVGSANNLKLLSEKFPLGVNYVATDKRSFFVLVQASHGLKAAGDYLQNMKNRGAQLVGKVTSKFSGVVCYSIYAYEGVIAWQASPTPFRTVTQLATRVVSNITGGYVAQQATEKVGSLIGSAFRLFKFSRQTDVITKDSHNQLRLG